MATILKPASSIIFKIAPEFPSAKASGLIIVNVLLVAMLLVFHWFKSGAKIDFFAVFTQKVLLLSDMRLIISPLVELGIVKKILTFANYKSQKAAECIKWKL